MSPLMAAGVWRQALEELHLAFTNRSKAFDEVIKIGRTQLQDAVPMALGQELGAFAAMLADSGQRIDEARSALTEVNLGGVRWELASTHKPAMPNARAPNCGQ